MKSRWFSPRAWLLHLALVIVVPGCAVAAWWQVTVALAGDGLGWLYSVEWPCFAIFATVVWWNLIHDDPDAVGNRAIAKRRTASTMEIGEALDPDRIRSEESQDPELARYNAYLEGLAARDHARGWRRP